MKASRLERAKIRLFNAAVAQHIWLTRRFGDLRRPAGGVYLLFAAAADWVDWLNGGSLANIGITFACIIFIGVALKAWEQMTVASIPLPLMTWIAFSQAGFLLYVGMFVGSFLAWLFAGPPLWVVIDLLDAIAYAALSYAMVGLLSPRPPKKRRRWRARLRALRPQLGREPLPNPA